MRLLAASSVLLATAIGTLADGTRAQDPSRDLPAARVPGVTAEQAMSLGLARLRTGWNWEGARMFRELQVLDADKPMPHLLLALAFRDVPNRAARLCFDAVARRAQASSVEQPLLAAYQLYFGVTGQPELNDARFQAMPDRLRHQALLRTLRQLSIDEAAGKLASELLAVEHAHAAAAASNTLAWNKEKGALVLEAHHSYLSQHRLMPFMIPGYAQLFESSRALSFLPAEGWDTDLEMRKKVMGLLPRHPHHAGVKSPVPMLPGLKLHAGAAAGPMWRPRPATPFALPRGVGGTGQLSDYEDKPVLVVFFLGFGCAHCVAQLADLDPKTPKFRDAGIEVVTIGTDDLNAVRAARQAADENGVDPLHFDVLCDPDHKVFKQWGVWDEFSNEALHGSFLVDGKGRILWQDVSLRPFEESDWLLAECKRLLGAWK
tara:strand:+ start:1047 stop:2342 length:1296 start_codon:yes stop_codon:yes gene_type:complete